MPQDSLPQRQKTMQGCKRCGSIKELSAPGKTCLKGGPPFVGGGPRGGGPRDMPGGGGPSSLVPCGDVWCIIGGGGPGRPGGPDETRPNNPTDFGGPETHRTTTSYSYNRNVRAITDLHLAPWQHLVNNNRSKFYCSSWPFSPNFSATTRFSSKLHICTPLTSIT